MRPSVNLFWFRRDLRLHDNAGLYHALKSGRPVVPVFIFDRHILDDLSDKRDRRVEFIHRALEEMQGELKKTGSTLEVCYGYPEKIFPELLAAYGVETIYSNHDYEPYARQRDEAVKQLAKDRGTGFRSFKDQVIFEKEEVVKDDGRPYTVFTPYSRKWKSQLTDFYRQSYPVEKYRGNFFVQPEKKIPSLAGIGFEPAGLPFPAKEWRKEIIHSYREQRDFPGNEGTTRLGVHLRFGTISIRELVREAGALNETFLNELIWREFYQMILWHFPQVVGQAFKPEYDRIRWRNNEKELEAWSRGETGYPIVDAGMRELNQTGYMHNRVRMIVASFLTKHLLTDWCRGEAYFARKLLDFDLASNNGGWQWAAGSGCDAAPYFRIFNPYLQTKKFDPTFTYIRKWVPEWQEVTYPRPLVDHETARRRCLQVYAAALSKEALSRNAG